ncbi:unnamed protein product [Rangifer tarandus platyrhynchus]|uniref:Uncharacterized protein n=2 Tax=Rangifer tarandus platyrhynchus TaxID=3082113 RepID=A0AC59Z6C6_RANTA|nr:unnamed protein product [Rangifer tarandus platyrhynchus]
MQSPELPGGSGPLGPVTSAKGHGVAWTPRPARLDPQTAEPRPGPAGELPRDEPPGRLARTQGPGPAASSTAICKGSRVLKQIPFLCCKGVDTFVYLYGTLKRQKPLYILHLY